MKTKFLILPASLLLINFIIATVTLAQKPLYDKPNHTVPKQIQNHPDKSGYSFRLYSAPNNAYGYDILKYGKPVYHQYVLTFLGDDGERVFVSKQETEKVAAISVERIKKGMRPFISETEVKKIILNRN
jgi:hypothetical protein